MTARAKALGAQGRYTYHPEPLWWVEGFVRAYGHAIRVGAVAMGRTPEEARRDFVSRTVDASEGAIRPVDVLITRTTPRPDLEAEVAYTTARALEKAAHEKE